jgi:hypothetical protein
VHIYETGNSKPKFIMSFLVRAGQKILGVRRTKAESIDPEYEGK